MHSDLMHSDLVTFLVAMTKYAKEELTGRRLFWGSQSLKPVGIARAFGSTIGGCFLIDELIRKQKQYQKWDWEISLNARP